MAKSKTLLKALTIVLTLLLIIQPIIIYAENNVTENFDCVGLEWQYIWRAIKRHSYWALEYHYQGEWYQVNQNLTIQRDYISDTDCKLTFIFDAPYQGDYRLTLAIDKHLLQYTELTSNSVRLEYSDYALEFDYSDIMNIPNIIVNKGVKNVDGQDWFYARFRKNNVPKDYHMIIDPILTITDTYGDETYISNLDQLIVTDGHVELDQYLDYPGSWFNQDWLSCVTLTIDQNDIDSALTNFPVLVYLNSSNVDWTRIQDDLDDIRFTADNITALKYEIENYVTNDEAWLWVKVPSINDAADTEFYMYYNNPDASSGEDIVNVWDDNFVMVQHMIDETTSSILDSTQYDGGGTKKGTNEPVEETGYISDAQHFDGSDDYISVTDHAGINIQGNFTISAWVQYDSESADYQQIVGKDSGSGYNFHMRTDEIIWGEIYDGAWKGAAGTTVLTMGAGNWYHVAFNFANPDMDIFLNGADDTNGNPVSGNPTASTGVSLFISRAAWGGARFLDGIVDEARVSNISRGADWIKAEYESGRNDLITYGSAHNIPSVYYDYGYLYSVNMLKNLNSTDLIALTYNTSIIANEGIDIEFSQDNSTWVNSDDLSMWENLVNGNNELNLQALDYDDKAALFYRINMTQTGGTTPELYFVTYTYSTHTQSGIMIGAILTPLIIIIPLLALLFRRR